MGEHDDLIERAEALLDAATPGPWSQVGADVEKVRDGDWASVVGTMDEVADATLIAATPSLIADLQAALREADTEIERLRDWKESATEELGRWDAVFRALGSPGQLGERMADASAERAAELVAEIERLRTARAVAEEWRDSLMTFDSGRGCAHPLAMVLAALDGETDPTELGVDPDEHARRLAAAPSTEEPSDVS